MRESGRPEALTARSQSGDVDVPPEEWIAFLDSFSRQHEGWLASVSVTRGSETLSEVKDCQVKGISADHVDERDRIYISIGRNGEHLTHPVTNPMRVTFKRDLGGGMRAWTSPPPMAQLPAYAFVSRHVLRPWMESFRIRNTLVGSGITPNHEGITR